MNKAMKKLLLLFTTIAMTLSSWAASVSINSTTFPDAVFRNFVTRYVPGGSDGVFTDAEIAAITEIDIAGWQHGEIADMTGVQYFTNLRKLDLGTSHEVRRLPLRGLTHLTFLRFEKGGDEITMYEDIDLYDCTELDTLCILNEFMTELDLSRQTKLKYLSLRDCNLTSINLTNKPQLQYLNIESNQLSSRSLDVSQLANLRYLGCKNCNLTSLNITGCTQLTELNCSWNAFDMTQLNLSTNSALVKLDCSCSYGSGVLNLSNQPNLEELICNNCNLTGFNCREVPNLKILNIMNNNGLTSLDVGYATNLEELHCGNCGLTTLRVNNKVGILNASLNPNLTTINFISGANASPLYHLEIDNTSISSFPFNIFPNLFRLYAAQSKLKSVDFSANLQLYSANMSSCEDLEEVILPKGSVSFFALYIGNTKVRHLDASNLNNLEILDASWSELEDLKLTNTSHLRSLNLYYSKLTQLDLSNQVSDFYHFENLTSHVYAPVYRYDGKLYIKIHPKYDTFDTSRVSEFKVNNVAKSVVMRDGCLLEVGNEGDNVNKVSYKYDTQCHTTLNGSPIENPYLNYVYETYNEVERVQWMIPIDAAHFPDAQLRELVSTEYSDDADWLKQNVAESFHRMNMEDKGIYSLEGVQYYSKLDTLWCRKNYISNFDMSVLPNLKFLNCAQNRIDPAYNAMAVATLLESLPDNDDTEKTLYYRVQLDSYETNVALTSEQCQYLKAKHWTPKMYGGSEPYIVELEYTGTVVEDSIWVKNTRVTAENCDDVLGDGTVSYDRVRNILTLNNAYLSSINKSLYCNKENLVIKLLGDNTTRISCPIFCKNTTIVGPGTLTMQVVSSFYTTGMIIDYGCSLHLTDSAWVDIQAVYTSSSGTFGKGILGTKGSTLKVDGDNAKLTITAGVTAIESLTNLELGEGYRVTVPERGYLNSSGTLVDADGNTALNATIEYSPLYGDANNDTYVNWQDVEALVNILIGKAERVIGADVNADGQVSIADLTKLVNMLKTPTP